MLRWLVPPLFGLGIGRRLGLNSASKRKDLRWIGDVERGCGAFMTYRTFVLGEMRKLSMLMELVIPLPRMWLEAKHIACRDGDQNGQST
jgi:hypothetical protein